jgi:hypothetical protein
MTRDAVRTRRTEVSFIAIARMRIFDKVEDNSLLFTSSRAYISPDVLRLAAAASLRDPR